MGARADVPPTVDAATRRLAQTEVPEAVRAVCRRLTDAGYAAVLVGGAVRDALLGVAVSDWDAASSATPAEVMALFERCIPTGVQHGTVTVLVGRPPEPVEITTFRGEAEYADGRRPTAVSFHRSLVDDLARRDLTINALAWDPSTETLTDPFDGLGDLRRGLIRAVGDPRRRFVEDGLRTMRAVRFCATLAMTLDPATAAAIPEALHVLAKVSRERIRVELFKLLGAPRPSRGLGPMAETGVWPHVVPTLDAQPRAETLAAIDAMPAEALPRLARLLRPLGVHPEGASTIARALDGLKLSRAERAMVDAWTGPAMRALADAASPAQIRQAVRALGRDRLAGALEVLGASPSRKAVVEAACAGAPLSVRALAIRGPDLVAAGIVQPGPRMGEILEALLQWTLQDPTRNAPAALLQHARTLPKSV